MLATLSSFSSGRSARSICLSSLFSCDLYPILNCFPFDLKITSGNFHNDT